MQCERRNAMYRTIIVDDDFLVRSYLKQLDAWEKAGYEITADLRDGEEALGMIKEQPPDVIVTDISMPLMDGIDLIRKVREMGLSTYIIVLSCHDDFNYVKEAMRLGANEYVLKNSLDEDSLFEVLKNAEHHMDSMKKQNTDEERTKKLIRAGSQSLKIRFFNEILAGDMSLKEREERRKEAGIKGKYMNSAVVNMFIPGWMGIKDGQSPAETEQYAAGFIERLSKQLEMLLGEESCKAETISLGGGIFCCFLDLSDLSRSSVMKQKLTSVASACFQCCKEEPYDYDIGVSNICIGEGGIRQAYQQARETIKLSFYEDSDILYFDSQKAIGTKMPDCAQELLSHAREYAAGRREKEMKAEFGQVIDMCRELRTDPKIIFRWIRRLDTAVGTEHSQEELFKLTHVEQLKQLFEDYRKKIFLGVGKEVPESAGTQIRQAVQYIREHFKEQIGLQEVADAVGLNFAYLSYLFKQEMGIGFSGFLLELRVEYAKDLLKNTSYKIKDVALESGFNDYHYFSKAFKRLNGISPAEYRRRS